MTDESAHDISAEGLAALEDELHALEAEGRRAIAERIKTAREWGDLKENAEYHDAKDAQAHLETKILRLRDLRHHAVVVEPGGAGDAVGLGVAVTVRDLGCEAVYTIVSRPESDPAAGWLSIDSPLGRALTGACVGDVVRSRRRAGSGRLELVAIIQPERHAEMSCMEARKLEEMRDQELAIFGPQQAAMYEQPIAEAHERARWYRAEAQRLRTRPQSKSRTWARFVDREAHGVRCAPARPHVARPASRSRGAGRPRAQATRSSSRSGDSGDDSGSKEADGEPPSSAASHLDEPSPRFSRPWRPRADDRLAELVERLERAVP